MTTLYINQTITVRDNLTGEINLGTDTRIEHSVELPSQITRAHLQVTWDLVRSWKKFLLFVFCNDFDFHHQKGKRTPENRPEYIQKRQFIKKPEPNKLVDNHSTFVDSDFCLTTEVQLSLNPQLFEFLVKTVKTTPVSLGPRGGYTDRNCLQL